jgi:hypothetical protein
MIPAAYSTLAAFSPSDQLVPFWNYIFERKSNLHGKSLEPYRLRHN